MAGSNFQPTSGCSSLYIKPFKENILNSELDVLQRLLGRLSACFVVIWSAVCGVCTFSSPVLLFEHWASFKLMYWYITCLIEDKSQKCCDLYLNFSILCAFKQPFAIPTASALQKFTPLHYNALLEGECLILEQPRTVFLVFDGSHLPSSHLLGPASLSMLKTNTFFTFFSCVLCCSM